MIISYARRKSTNGVADGWTAKIVLRVSKSLNYEILFSRIVKTYCTAPLWGIQILHEPTRNLSPSGCVDNLGINLGCSPTSTQGSPVFNLENGERQTWLINIHKWSACKWEEKGQKKKKKKKTKKENGVAQYWIHTLNFITLPITLACPSTR